jgi:hypothetical protein
LGAGLHAQHHHSTVRQDVGHAGGVVDGVQWHRRCAALQGRHVDAHSVQPIGQQDRHPLAWRHARCAQRPRPPRHAGLQGGPTHRLPGLSGAVVSPIGCALGRRRRAPGQDVDQGFARRHIGRQGSAHRVLKVSTRPHRRQRTSARHKRQGPGRARALLRWGWSGRACWLRPSPSHVLQCPWPTFSPALSL